MPPKSEIHEFALASARLLYKLLSTSPNENIELSLHIVRTLTVLLETDKDDEELFRFLISFAPEIRKKKYLQDPELSGAVGYFLLILGVKSFRRSDYKQTLSLYEKANTLISRESSLWVKFQLLAGDLNQALSSESGRYNERALQHYYNVLKAEEHIARDLRAQAATHLGLAYAVKPTGDKRHNANLAVHMLKQARAHWEKLGNISRVTETNVALGDVLSTLSHEAAKNSALEYYTQALETLRSSDSPAHAALIKRIDKLSTVQFTAYYPREIVSGHKYSFLVFAHLPELMDAIHREASKFAEELGGDTPKPRPADSVVKLAYDTLITVTPESKEMTFDPPELTKRWEGAFTRFLFDVHADDRPVGTVFVADIVIQVAGIEVARVRNCAMEVVAAANQTRISSLLQSAYLYQKIFVSYAREDGEVTRRYKLAQTAVGNDTFIDVDNLRSGDYWKQELDKAIDASDIFQLFWSGNSAKSEYCKYEWNHALGIQSHKCEGFVRPVYWEQPMPAPPPELSHINFKFVPFTDRPLEAHAAEGEHAA